MTIILDIAGLQPYLKSINHLDETIEVLQAVTKEAKRPPVDAYFKLGQAYHHQHDFEQAIHFYKQYLLKAPEKNRYYRSATYNIERCAIGLKYDFQRNDVFVGAEPRAGGGRDGGCRRCPAGGACG